MDVTIVMPTGVGESVPIKSFDTVRDVINNTLSNYSPEQKAKFLLVEKKKGRDGVVIERGLKDTMILGEAVKEWNTDKENVYSLALVMQEHEVIVNFNTYFRMMAGVSETRATFAISDSTSISMLHDRIKSHLKLPAAEQRFGLMGNQGGNLRKLFPNEKVLNLKTAWETPENTFFQFQVLPEMEDKRHLGADKESYLEVYQSFPPLWKKRWCSLRSNCLFIFKEKGEHVPVQQVDNVDKAKIIDQGASKKGLGQKFPFRFDIEAESQTSYFAVEDQQSLRSWVEALKSCGTRNDARSTNVDMKIQAQRTFLPVGGKQAGGGAKPEEVAKLTEAEKQDKHLEDLRKTVEELLKSRESQMVPATKALVSKTQEFTVAITQAVSESSPQPKKDKISGYTTELKATLKTIIPAAKAVGMQKDVVESSAEFKKLKKETQTLVDAAEMMLITLRTDDEDFVVEEKKEEFRVMSTGNTELDSIMSGLNAFGIAPELAEMMKQASSMQELDPFAHAQESQAQQQSFEPIQDDGLDSILDGLNSALDGLDIPGQKPKVVPKKEDTSGAERCALCLAAIQGRVVRALDRTWHPDCYYCAQCGTNLESHKSDTVFVDAKGMPYCKKDFLPLCPKCPVCTQPVLPKEDFPAFGKSFHQHCFRCQTCQEKIEGPGFERNGKPECEECHHRAEGTLCVECRKGIYGNAITVVGTKRHPHCFICSFCKKNLTKETARAKEQKLYCNTCLAQLFG